MTKATERNIYQRLHAVMRKVDFVAKGDKKVNGQYSYVSHDAVTAAVRPHLVDEGVIYFPQDLVTQQDGNRTEVHFNVRFVNVDQPTEFLDIPTFGYGIDPQDKGPGKAISYGVKMALLKALGLETGEDVEKDNIDHKPAAKAKEQPKEKTPQQIFLEKAKSTIVEMKTIPEVHQWAKDNAAHFSSLSEAQKTWLDKVMNTQTAKLAQAE